MLTRPEFIRQVSDRVKSSKPILGEPFTANSVEFWRNHCTELRRYVEALEADAEQRNNSDSFVNRVNDGKHNADTLHPHHANDDSELVSESDKAPSTSLPCK